MYIAILADIHGNLPALEAVVRDVQQYDVSEFISAGDQVGGPCPVETVRLLRSLGAYMVRGNNENYALRLRSEQAPEAWRVNKQWAFARHAAYLLDQQTLDGIAALPEQRVVGFPEMDAIRVVHGSPRDHNELLWPDRDPDQLAEVLALVKEPVMVYGHTHHPWVSRLDGKLALNPGSVGMPLNGDPRAQYALLAWQGGQWVAEHRLVSYALSRVHTVFQESGLLDSGGPLARAALLTIATGVDVGQAFRRHAYRLARKAGYGGTGVVPDAIWDEAVATFDWDAVTVD